MTRNIAESYVASIMVNKGLKLTKISVFGRFNRHTATHFVALSLKSLIILQLSLIIKYQNKIRHQKVRLCWIMVNLWWLLLTEGPKSTCFNHIMATSKVLWYWDHSQKFWAPGWCTLLLELWWYLNAVPFQVVKYARARTHTLLGFFNIPQLVVNRFTLHLH